MSNAIRQSSLEHNAAVRVFRSPRRITITMANAAYERLLERSDREGRSLSNLAAFLLESSLGSG